MNILITEDDFAIQILMRKQVERWGYTPTIASNGQEALNIVYSENPPDIILMDWVMPELTGIEACRRIKEDSSLPMIYIIMLTSKTGHQNIVEGLNSGADDYISKPVDSEELRSRLRVAKRTIKNERQLRKYASEMEILALERAQQLVHADRLVTIGTMSAGIVHEINNPLGAIIGTGQILGKYWELVSPLVDKELESRTDPKLALVRDDMAETIESIAINGKRITEIISTLKRFYKNNISTQMNICRINDCIESALKVCHPKLKNRVNTLCDLEDPSPECKINPQQIDQVLVNLIVNAAEAIEEAGLRNGEITIRTKSSDEMAVIDIENNGPTISDEIMDNLWNSFYTTKKEGTGLGLSISRDLITKHGGSMNAENLPNNKGVCFTIKIPLAVRD